MSGDNYGAFASDYERYADDPNGSEHRLARVPALQVLGDVRGKVVLDFGCNRATMSKHLSDVGAHVIGVDVKEELLAIARERDPLGQYLSYDGVHLYEVLSGRPVDCILASFSFCTVPSDNLAAILADMRRLLTPGGLLVILEPNLEKALGKEYRDLKYHDQPGVKSGDYVRVTLGVGERAVTLNKDIYRTHADYRRLLAGAGFEIVSWDEPRPDPAWEGDWSREAACPPFLLITAR